MCVHGGGNRGEEARESPWQGPGNDAAEAEPGAGWEISHWHRGYSCIAGSGESRRGVVDDPNESFLVVPLVKEGRRRSGKQPVCRERGDLRLGQAGVRSGEEQRWLWVSLGDWQKAVG